MKALAIIKPEPFAPVDPANTMARLTTPDPKEAATVNGTASIVFDFGYLIQLDTFFIGYHNGKAGQTWKIEPIDGPAGNPYIVFAQGSFDQFQGFGQFHTVVVGMTPYIARYWRLTIATGSTGSITMGVFAAGAAFVPMWGQELGAGRNITDTGTAERLFGGGFAIDEGARVGGYQWTFGDLQALEIRRLYQIVKDVGVTKTVLVVEDPEQTEGLNERVHWGLFGKLDFYERRDPANWKWGFQISDWG